MKFALLALSVLPATVIAQTSHSGAQHVHGEGHVEIVFSGAEFSLSLSVPGADIVGFEHPAENDADRALVAVAISDLSKPLEIFVPPEDAGCFAASANVTLTSDASQENDPDAETHTEFQADYQVQCSDIQAMSDLQFLYFDRFPKARKLSVQIVRAESATTHSITRAKPALDVSAP